MGKAKTLLALFVCMAVGLFGLTACGVEDVLIEKIEIDSGGVAAYVDGELTLPYLIVTAKGGGTTKVPITREMISDKDFAKLNSFGEHEITVNYEKLSTKFTLTIQGLDIADVEINESGELVIKYSDDTSKNVGKVVGDNGADGAQGATGATGAAGRGIAKLEIVDGNLMITYSDSESALNLGNIKGAQGETGATGADGRGVTDITMAADGTITITYTSGEPTVLSTYLTGFTVIFRDENNNIINKQVVRKGYSASVPTAPEKVGYDFIGWKKTEGEGAVNLVEVNSDLDVTASYLLKAVDTSWYNISGRVFEISTAQQLAGLSELVNSGIDSFKGKLIKLAADIDLSALDSWTPIGRRVIIKGLDVFGNEINDSYPNMSNAFKGTFDGHNFSVKNYIDENLVWENEFSNTAALFGVVSGSIIKNLKIDGFVLTGDKSLAGVASWVYGDAAFRDITVQNCVFTNTSKTYGMGAIFARSHNYNTYDVCKQDAIITLENCVVDNVILDCGGKTESLYNGANVGSLWGSITLAKDGDSGGTGMNAHIKVKNCSSSAVIKNGVTNNGEIGGYGNCKTITVDGWEFTGRLLGYNNPDGSEGKELEPRIIGYAQECQLYVSDATAFNSAVASPSIMGIYLTNDIEGAVIERVKGNANLSIYLQGYKLSLKEMVRVGAGATLNILNINSKFQSELVNNGIITRPATGAGLEKNTVFYVEGALSTTSVDIEMDAFDESAEGSSYGVRVVGAGSKYTMNSGSNTAVYGVTVSKGALFTMNGGLIESKYICVSANGYYQNAGYTVNIKAGSILRSPDTIIYMPSEGAVTIGGTADKPVIMENTTIYTGTGAVPYGIVVRAGTLTINNYVNLKMNAAINPNGNITAGGSGSIAGAIVIGKPASATVKTPDGVYSDLDGYVGNVKVTITGAQTTIENVNALGYAIYKGEKSIKDKGYTFTYSVAANVTLTGTVSDDKIA